MLDRSCFLAVCLACLLVLACGCSSFRDTYPARSATEQVLISTAADRAIEGMNSSWIRGRTIYVDASNLEAYDSAYVVQRVRSAVLENGGRLSDSRTECDAILEVASGGLSVDTGGFLLGLPSLSVPVPFGGESLVLPEVALFKVESRVGKAKLLFSAIDAATGAQVARVPISYGRATRRFLWFFLLGPFEGGDVPEELQ